MSEPGAFTHEALMAAVAQDQDREAFRSLFEYFSPRLRGYLRQLGSDDGVVEELVQETMVTVWRRATTYDVTQAKVSTWIFTIARNKRIDMIRRTVRPELDPNDPALIPEAEEQADDRINRKQREALIRDALATLPDNQAQMLRLSFFEGKSHSVIASELDLPLGTVKSRLRLAMNRLRSVLGEVQ